MTLSHYVLKIIGRRSDGRGGFEAFPAYWDGQVWNQDVAHAIVYGSVREAAADRKKILKTPLPVYEEWFGPKQNWSPRRKEEYPDLHIILQVIR